MTARFAFARALRVSLCARMPSRTCVATFGESKSIFVFTLAADICRLVIAPERVAIDASAGVAGGMNAAVQVANAASAATRDNIVLACFVPPCMFDADFMLFVPKLISPLEGASLHQFTILSVSK